MNGAAMTTPDGSSAVAVDIVESTTTLWDLPGVDTATLAKMCVRARAASVDSYPRLSRCAPIRCVAPVPCRSDWQEEPRLLR